MKLKYRPEIDGLRALAVLPVIFFHAGISIFNGGFVGVDIFFVISGYLITSILIEDLSKERFSLSNFYERRARRILPALVFVSFFTVILGWIILNPIELFKLGTSLVGVATFTSNIVFWDAQGYFEESAELNPLLHTWSLAVEEQFYLFFPILLFFLWKYGKQNTLWVIFFISFISLALSEWGWRNQSSANFYLIPTRIWELFAGSIAALISTSIKFQKNNILSIFGFLMIVISIFIYDESTPFPSLYTLLPVLGVLLVILFGSKETLVGKLLSSNILVGIGLISYSAYLWHQPLFAFSRHFKGQISISSIETFAILMSSIILAFLTWKYIEKPFRDRSFLSRKKIAIVSISSLAFIAGLGILSRHVSNNFEYTLAKQLSKSDYVYYGNVDDRKFIASRLSLPLNPVSSLIVGSSRIMQVNSKIMDEDVINLSVSGASVEDNVAIIGEAYAKLKPSKVYIGADPWLINKNNFQDRWQSIEDLYLHWMNFIKSPKAGAIQPNATYLKQSSLEKNEDSALKSIFKKFNFSDSIIALNDSPEAIDKKAYDGLHIYNEKYISKKIDPSGIQFNAAADYSMGNFSFDDQAESKLRLIIKWLIFNKADVYLVMSPYHSGLHKNFIDKKNKFHQAENFFIELAEELNITALGSYDALKVGCEDDEFYDMLHPKISCMEKVLNYSSN